MENQYKKVAPTILNYLDEVEIGSMKDCFKDDVFHYDIRSLATNNHGTGSDSIREIAFLKAQTELIERLTISLAQESDRNIKTSNGFAAHTNLAIAQRSAFKELIERDLFLTSWFSGHYPSWDIKHLNSIDFDFLESNVKLFKTQNFGLKVGHIGRCGNHQCLVAVLYDLEDRFGGVFAAVADEDINSALKKVVIDQRRMATYISNSINSDLPLYTEISDLVKPTDHQNYYLNLKRKDFINNYINTSREPIELSPINAHYAIYELPEAISNSIKVVQCMSDEVQDYFIGADVEANINISRIKEIGELDLSRRIHPFG
jgi:hypothetical protein